MADGDFTQKIDDMVQEQLKQSEASMDREFARLLQKVLMDWQKMLLKAISSQLSDLK